MARLHPPKVTDTLVPVFTSGELSALQKTCAGRTFAQRRDAAIIAVFRATGIRLAELAAICYHPDDTQRSDLDLWQREITVRGKAGKPRIVRFSYPAARRWTAICGCGPGTPRRGGRSCGWGPAIAGR
jgi:site-specific recombinase XerD